VADRGRDRRLSAGRLLAHVLLRGPSARRQADRATLAVARCVVEFAFGGLVLIPGQADARIPEEGITWKYTTWLNITFLLLAATLLVRFLRTGGPATLRMMGGSPEAGEQGHEHAHTRHGHSL
jgi:hypothetical protein